MVRMSRLQWIGYLARVKVPVGCEKLLFDAVTKPRVSFPPTKSPLTTRTRFPVLRFLRLPSIERFCVVSQFHQGNLTLLPASYPWESLHPCSWVQLHRVARLNTLPPPSHPSTVFGAMAHALPPNGMGSATIPPALLADAHQQTFPIAFSLFECFSELATFP